MLKNLDRIAFDPKIMTGKACIRGMRVPVSLIVNLVANGKTTKEIIEDYPYLEPEDIKQALLYAAWLTEEKASYLKKSQEEAAEQDWGEVEQKAYERILAGRRKNVSGQEFLAWLW